MACLPARTRSFVIATPIANLIAPTGDPLKDPLLQGSAWSFTGAHVLSYSFNLNFDFDANGNVVAAPGGAWTPALSAAFTRALGSWSNVANLSFTNISSGNYVFESNADIAAALTGDDLQKIGALALGFFPDPAYATSVIESAGYTRAQYARPEGDVLLDNYFAGYSHLQDGGFGYWAMIHEIGHALGLKHSFDDGGNGRPTYSGEGLPQYDDERYTVMSYSGIANATGSGHAATPMPLDILAIQHIYGANLSYMTADSNYLYGPGSAFMSTIWDAGGVDSIELPAFSAGLTLDLRPGAVMNLPDGSVLAIAYNCIIENAVGGAGDDTLIGNAAANVLTGNGGINTYAGGAGDDSLVGGSGIDTAVLGAMSRQFTIIGNPATTASITGPDGSDNLNGIEKLRYLDGTRSYDAVTGIGGWTVDSGAGSVARLYWATLGRAPDAAGFTGWANTVHAGAALGTVAAAFVGSGEFQGTYGSLDNPGFVNRLYLNVLNRTADAGGLAAWVGALNGGSSRADVTLGFSDSGEFQMRMAPNIDGGIVATNSVSGDNGANTLTGSGLIDTISGLGGNDSLSGGDANDTLNGGAGDDSLDGGAGFDVAQLSGSRRQYGLSGNPVSAGSSAGADGNDTLAGIETLSFVDGNLNFDPASAIAQISRLYWATLNRQGDALGVDVWRAQREAGTTLDTIAQSFIGSGEFQGTYGALNDTQFVQQLYLNVLGRTADAPGLATWTGYLGSGGSRGSVVTGFSESGEHIDRRAADVNAGLWEINGNAAGVARLYWATLDRAPDVAGLSSWVGALNGGLALAGAAGSFVASSEFQGRYGALNDSAFVNQLYINVLNRAADAGGLTAWLGYLSGGGTRGGVVTGFSESDEFKGKSLPLIDRGVTVSDTQAAYTGTAAGEAINGSAADNIIAGGLGNDTLSGGAGGDRFVFNTATNAASNLDTLTDFASGSDTLVLDHHIFAALSIGSLSGASLVSGVNPVAADGNDFILYNTATGLLSYDADGSGAGVAVGFASLTTKPALTAADFLVA